VSSILLGVLCLIVFLAAIGAVGFVVALKMGVIVHQATKPAHIWIPATTPLTRGAKCDLRRKSAHVCRTTARSSDADE
jgi:hypothetical protein